ncbi:hypothetical protein BH10BAC2_BH10BAC2_08740 [soil metagenome]
MKKTVLLILLLTGIAVPVLYAQKLPATLLWKISGNGLQKPSYLYGTMHLTDERLFNLGDSLYAAIERSEGFAIEINPDDFTLMMIDEAKKTLMEGQRIKNMLSEREFKKYGAALAKKLDKKEEDIITGDIFREKNKWVQESYRTGKMKTFLDAYLFDVARRLGKWTGGVENMSDQQGLLDNIVDESDIQELAGEDGSDDKQVTLTINQMIKYYLSSDLNAIDSLSGFGDSLYHDALLTKRNIKMAMRMDSLGHERSMVFAVGAAHLPGDDGLIALLKEKGFTVTPVFASKKIKLKDYKIAEVSFPWYNVKDDNASYTASMPGKAGNMTMYGILDMKMYFDVFNSTVYMTTAMNTPYTQHMADSVFGTIANYYFAATDYTKGKPITINDIPGREFISGKGNYSHGYLLYKDGMLYMAIGMSMKKDTASAKDINKFLQSFTILKSSAAEHPFITYTDKVKAYSIELPSQPKSANDFVGKDEAGMINRQINISTDQQTGAYLLFGFNEAAPGYYIPSDSATFEEIKASQKDKFAEITIDTNYTKNNRKVMEFGGIMATAPLMMKAYYEFRGNRWYALVAIYDPAKPAPSVERFFKSFTILDYPATAWKQYTAEDNLFITWAPAKFGFEATPEDGEDTTYKYESFDTARADNFAIVPADFGNYYWQVSDSALWETIVKSDMRYNDSLLSKEAVTNGEAKGVEIFVQREGAGNVTRKRMLLNGNKVYTLLTVQPAAEIHNSNNNKFFEDFRFSKTASSENLFISKATNLLTDLNNSDSAVHEAAREAFSIAPFTKEELPLLHQALLKQYPWDTVRYQKINTSIQNEIINLEDISSYDFAKRNYLQVSDEHKKILLEIMASFPTKEHFDEIKTFLLKAPPKIEWGYGFINDLKDTAQLTAGIFPDLLPLLKDTVLAASILEIARPLLDSNLISATLLNPYQADIMQFAQKQYRIIKADPENYDYTNYSLIHILGKFNNDAANLELQKWSLLKDYYLQLDVLDMLLANKQAINPQVLQTLAADKANRTAMYEKLKKYKKESLFPKKYLTQKDFAESYVYTVAADEDEPSELTYLTQKVISFKGVQSRFFFYKVTYGEDDNTGYMLACAGPFNTNAAHISSDEATGELLYDEDFDPSSLPEQMDKIVKQMEDWYKPGNATED